ncbi:MAG: AraC family transcriptional regulator [Bacteroidota bacterium]
MEGHYIRHLKCGEVEIAASCEDRSGQPLEAYLTNNVLFYTQTGQINVEVDKNLYAVPRGCFCLLRKHTSYRLWKTWGKEEHHAKTYGFSLTNDFIRKSISKVNFPSDLKPIADRFLSIPTTAQLQKVIGSMIEHIDNNTILDDEFVEKNTFEALQAIINADKKVAVVFKEFSLSARADLEKLMTHNYLFNISLADLASRSGRSLSTFNRDFKRIYNDTPHRWIMNKRLEHAHNLIVTEKQRPSEVYLQCGFEDLAHFSRAFKKKFNMAPSLLLQQVE